MNTNTQERPQALRRKKTITGSLVAGVGALAFALATPLAAHAATVITAGDLDFIEVEATESAPNSQIWDVELLGHDHDGDTEFDPASVTYEITAGLDGVAWISEDPGLSSPLSAGFSPGSADFLADLDTPSVRFSLDSATRTGTTTGTGAVVFDDGGDIYLDFDADLYGSPVTPDYFDLTAHSHPDISFAGKGIYTLVFEVSVDYSAPTVVTGLPDTVTVIVEVV